MPGIFQETGGAAVRRIGRVVEMACLLVGRKGGS